MPLTIAGLTGSAGQQQQQPERRMLKVGITGAANNGSGLIRITTAAPHRFATGNKITITGVGGTVEANGASQTITVITTTTFDLVGSTFTNAYTSGGVATRPAL
jgi:hypothetical protein